MGEMLPLTAEDGHTLSGYRDYGSAIAEHAQEKPRCPVLHVYPPVAASTATNEGAITSPAPRWRAPGRWTSSNSTWGRRSGPC